MEYNSNSENRDFKGIWISKEVWHSKEIPITFKMILLEIDTLSKGERGCDISFNYFSDLFLLSQSECNHILEELKQLAYITIKEIYDSERKFIATNYQLTEQGILFLR